MALKIIDRVNVRKELKVPGVAIRKYVTGDFKLRINPDLIMRILEDYGIDAGGDKVHKIIFSDNKEFFLTDAGVDQLVAV